MRLDTSLRSSSATDGAVSPRHRPSHHHHSPRQNDRLGLQREALDDHFVTLVGVSSLHENEAIATLRRQTECSAPLDVTRSSRNALVLQYASVPMAQLAATATSLVLSSGDVVTVAQGRSGTRLVSPSRDARRSARKAAGKKLGANTRPLQFGRLVHTPWWPVLGQVWNWLKPSSRTVVGAPAELPKALLK
jgi:hypothetical protein